MLIVVAIIGVLVAIMVPTFTSQLEKAKEATDAANIRAAISELTTKYLNNELTFTGTANNTKDVVCKQTVSGWSTITEINGTAVGASSGTSDTTINGVGKDRKVIVTISDTGAVTLATAAK